MHLIQDFHLLVCMHKPVDQIPFMRRKSLKFIFLNNSLCISQLMNVAESRAWRAFMCVIFADQPNSALNAQWRNVFVEAIQSAYRDNVEFLGDDDEATRAHLDAARQYFSQSDGHLAQDRDQLAAAATADQTSTSVDVPSDPPPPRPPPPPADATEEKPPPTHTPGETPIPKPPKPPPTATSPALLKHRPPQPTKGLLPEHLMPKSCPDKKVTFTSSGSDSSQAVRVCAKCLFDAKEPDETAWIHQRAQKGRKCTKHQL